MTLKILELAMCAAFNAASGYNLHRALTLEQDADSIISGWIIVASSLVLTLTVKP
jgi:hypothetical protein